MAGYYDPVQAERYADLARSAHLRVHRPDLVFGGPSAYLDSAAYWRTAYRLLPPDHPQRAEYADRARLMEQRGAETHLAVLARQGPHDWYAYAGRLEAQLRAARAALAEIIDTVETTPLDTAGELVRADTLHTRLCMLRAQLTPPPPPSPFASLG